MPRRGNCCRCLAGSCSTGLIFTGRRNALLSWLTKAVSPPVPLPNPDDRGFPTRFLVLRPWLEWVSGTTRRPRGGSLLADLQANAISVGANVALFWDRPTSQVLRNLNASLFGFSLGYTGDVTLTETELEQRMSASLFGDAFLASSALRLTPVNGNSQLGFAFNANSTYFSDNRVYLLAGRLQPASDRTQLFSRRAIVMNGSTRLVQPFVGQSIDTAFQGGIHSANSIEILTASPADGVIVATAKPQSLVEFPFGWGGSASSPMLIWPEALWKPPHSKNPLAGLGGYAYRAKIYRDGEYVETVNRTPPAQPSDWVGAFAEHTGDDGAYFIVFDSNAGQLQGFLSFVIDRTPPMGVFKQVNDFFEGDPTNASGVPYDGNIGKVRRFTTEPTRTFASVGQEWRSYSSTRSEFSRDLEPGNQTLEYPGSFFDEVGNPMPTPLPTAQFQVHAVPDGQKYGAQATLALPPNQDSLVYDDPVPSISVTFNRAVSGLRKSMFSVTGTKADGTTINLEFDLSGENGGISGSTQGSGTTFTLALDEDEQDYNTSWLVVFNPKAGGQLLADAGEDEPETCLLKSRCAWLIRQDPKPGRTPIDTSSSAVSLVRVPTLTATLAESALPELPERNDSLIDLSADIVLPVTAIPPGAPPMGCYEQVNDFFQGDPTNASGIAWDKDGVGAIARVQSEKTWPDQDGANTPPDWDGTSTVSRFLEVAEHTIENPGTFRDADGIAMPAPPTAQFRVHSLPSSGKMGAHAWISLQGDSASNKGAMLRGEVSFLTITFNRAIKGLRKNMISVVGTLDSGTPVTPAFRLYQGPIFGPELVDDDDDGVGSTFTIVFEEAARQAQVVNSRWLVTLTPGSSLKVPAVGDSEEEPCVLAARRAWLIPQTESPYEDSSQTAWYRYGRSSPFVPQVPPSLDEATDVPYSYFGLSTTLFPSPPGALPCPAPGDEQPRSSLIVGNSNITSLTVGVSGNQYIASPMTFSSSLNGEQCSQNVWVNAGDGGGGATGESHYTRSRQTTRQISYAGDQLLYQNGPASAVKAIAYARGSRWAITATTGTAVAGRSAATYSALQTSTLGQLTVRIETRAFGSTSVYDGNFGNLDGLPAAVVYADPENWRTVASGMTSELQAAIGTIPDGPFAIPPQEPGLLALYIAWRDIPADKFPGELAAKRQAARHAFVTARDNYRNARTLNAFDRNWPPSVVQLSQDENGNITPAGNQQRIGVLAGGGGGASFYASTPLGDWLPMGDQIIILGPKVDEPIEFLKAGYSPGDYPGDYIESTGNNQVTLPTASLTFTRQQEETLASGGSVQFTVGNLVYTISAS